MGVILSIARISVEVVRQKAAHPSETDEQIFARVAEALGTDAAVVAEAMAKVKEGQQS